jgi:YHS domain-containing protein
LPSQPVPAADFYLEHLSRSLWDPVDTTQVGSLNAKLHARVNGEIYRFSRPATLDKFKRDPRRWCGILRDPVNGVRFVPPRGAPRIEYKDGPYFFTSDSTRAVFVADPEKFAIHRLD